MINDEFIAQSQSAKKANRDFYERLRKKPSPQLDKVFHEAHEEVFENVDCLSCGNCCRTTSPVFYERDIDRASKAVRMRPGQFIDKYLRVDEEGDYVYRSAPCPFLGDDNHCSIYADRPTACREYPHTNRKNMYQVMTLTYRNTLVCPAVLKITELVRERL